MKNKDYGYNETTGKTETFFSRHVKLITFLICIGVFLAIFAPIAVLEAHDYLTGLNLKTKPDMMLVDVVRFSEQNGKVYAKQFEEFDCEIHKSGDTVIYSADIETCYSFYAVADSSTGKVTAFYLTDKERDETVNVLTDNVKAFLMEKEE